MSEQIPIYRALAAAFAAEGTDTLFTLMGDGNMHWSTAMAELPGMQVVHVRHEHAAVAMAVGYQGARGGVGVASITCGPGLTQLMTALTQACRNGVPLVVFAGEVPMKSRWYNQTIDQAALVYPTGAAYVALHTPERAYQQVQAAFHQARREQRPVVLGVPYDLQKLAMPPQGDYVPSLKLIPPATPVSPDAGAVAALADKLAAAEFPILLAGKGAIAGGGAAEVEALADLSGGLLATTLPMRGLYDHHPFSIGISGGYAREFARELAGQADLVLAFGASLSTHTVDGGSFYGDAHLVQIDKNPMGLNEGICAADEWLTADAGLTAAALKSELAQRKQVVKRARSNETAERLSVDVGDSYVQDVEPGLVDPRRAIDALDAVLPKAWDTVSGSGHQSYFHSVMRGRKPETYHIYKSFGAIGSGLCFAAGVASARGGGRDNGVVLFDGDGSLMMNAQELDTLNRHNLKVLVCVMNDGAYGSEIHKLRRDGLDDSGAIHGRADFAAIAQGFGLRGENVTDVSQIPDVVEAFQAGDTAMIMNIHACDQVMNPRMRRATATVS